MTGNKGPFKTNNFDFIRIVAASMVLISHHFALTAQQEPSFFGIFSLGGLAVAIFFVISGYLVMTSWKRDPNLLRFALRRFLRIWPALICVVVFTAYVLGPIVTELPVKEYLRHGATSDYLRTLYMQIYYVLPGVFEHNPYARGVNGSLWTIPYEVRCYIVLGIAGIIGLLKYRSIFLATVAIYLIWFLSKSNADLTQVTNYGRELSAYFLIGAALAVLEPYWSRAPLLGIDSGHYFCSLVVDWLAAYSIANRLAFSDCLYRNSLNRLCSPSRAIWRSLVWNLLVCISRSANSYSLHIFTSRFLGYTFFIGDNYNCTGFS